MLTLPIKRVLLSAVITAAAALIPQAHAGKGAWVRVFNLTDDTIALSTAMSGFESAAGKGTELSGSIRAKSVFPASGPVYIEEKNWIRDSDMDMTFKSPQAETSTIEVSYGFKKPYYEAKKSSEGELFTYSAITQNETSVDKGSSQVMINVFVARHKVTRSSWMSQIDDKVSLGQLFIPGTHDTATGELIVTVPHLATQKMGYRRQLENGIRYFDLRLAPVPTPTGSVELMMVHGVFPLGHTFSRAIETTIDFLKKNPEEAVLFQLKFDDGNWPSEVKAAIDANKKYFYTGSSVPTMGEARGKIVVLRRMNLSYGIDVGKDWPENGVGGNTSHYVQDWYEAGSDGEEEKLKKVNSFYENECKFSASQPNSADAKKTRLNINFLSATFGVKFPYEMATGVSGRGDSLNVKYARFFNGYSTLPAFHAVMLMDGAVPEDGLAQTALLLNFHTFGKKGSEPKVGQTYQIRPLIAPTQVLNLDVGGKKETTLHEHHPVDSTWAWQYFTLEKADQAGKFRIRSADAGGSSLHLDAFDGTKSERVLGISGGNRDNQTWTIQRHRPDSPYYRIISSVDNKALDVISGRTSNGAAVRRFPSNGTYEYQLWRLDEAKAP